MICQQVEPSKFHGFGEPFDAGAEPFYFQTAAFFCAEQELGGDGIPVEPDAGEATVDLAEINVVAVKVFIDDAISGYFMPEGAVADAEAAGGDIPSGGVEPQVEGVIGDGGGIVGERWPEAVVIGEGKVGSGKADATDAGDFFPKS